MLTGKIAIFVYGALFGSAGLRILASRDARKVYTHLTAAGLRCKQELMRNVDQVQAVCSDILADAKKINAEREAAESVAFVEDASQPEEEAAEA